ncbi:MAG: hypothetical protein AAGC72_11165 [Planctomycetota bacterium]
MDDWTRRRIPGGRFRDDTERILQGADAVTQHYLEMFSYLDQAIVLIQQMKALMQLAMPPGQLGLFSGDAAA